MMDLDYDLDFLANRTSSMGAKRDHDNLYLGSRSFTSYRDRLLQDKYALAADLKYSSSASRPIFDSSQANNNNNNIDSFKPSIFTTPTTTATAGGAGGSSSISNYLAGSSALISGAGGSNPLLNKTASQYTSSIANSANIDKLISSSTGFYNKGTAYTGGVGSSSYLAGGGGSLSHLPPSALSIATTAAATTAATTTATAAATTTWASTTASKTTTGPSTTTAPNIGHSASNNYSTTSAAINSSSAAAAAAANKQPSLYSNGQLNHSMGAGDQSRPAGGHQMGALQQLFDDLRQIEDTVDSIEIPARGRCRVYMAKYGYDPFKQSPNDNPDAELAFNAGDHIMVFDDIDEDGYFIGELMDGRRGYVPSNWLNQLTGEDLFEFQATTLYKQAHALSGGGAGGGGAGNAAAGILAGKIGTAGYTGGICSATGMAGLGMAAAAAGAADDDSECNSYPPEFYDAIVSDTLNHSNFQHLLAPEDYHRMNGYVDLDDVNEVDDECLSDYERAEAEQMRRAVPPPQRLILERQLNKSILIGWLHPQAAKGTIVSYQVYVDGVLKSTVPSGDRTKALLEGVDSNIPHRISVRAIDLNGRHSNDAGCTIVIGQRIPFAPSCVKASHITSDSALISWLPCNSNFHHVVAVNSVEVQTVRPGVYKHLINGLSANTLYRVWVRAKPGKIFSIDEKNPKKLESLTTYVDFKTMPKSLPDPPVNVQVEAGPQRRTLLVTWLPLTLNDYGSSNGCAVTGYAVFAGHKKLADIDSPTGDHALLDLADLESLHKKSVTVRTKSGENLSQDSMPCQIPDEYLKAGNVRPSDHHHHLQHHSTVGPTATRHQHQQHHPHHHQQQQRVSDPMLISSTSGHQSPMRQQQQQHAGAGRYGGQQSATKMLQQHQQHRGLVGPSKYSMARGRHLARSLQNLESDLDSRRSSIPAIEVTRETSGSEMINQTESYSEEEFENSMRFRASAMRGSGSNSANKPGSRMAANRYRARQSHSVDGAHRQLDAAGGHNVPAYAQQAGGRSNQNNSSTIFNSSTANNQRDNIIRYFVALFDYDPSTMSPNPNAASEELAFKAGSVIKIYGDKGADEFYRGELDNRIGFVPSNVVEEIKDPNRLFSLQQQDKYSANMLMNNMRSQQQQQPTGQMGGVVGNNLQQQQQQQPNPRTIDATNQQGVKRMKAMYDYDPQENSPNADTESEIPFKFGDIIYVYGKMDTDGFYMGEVERTKQRGLVPSNFLAEDPQPGQQQQQPFASGNQMMGQAGMMMDNFQQQQPRPNQQFVGNLAVQQQQQMQRPGGIQGVLPPQSQNLNRADGMMQPQNNAVQQQQQQQQNINRPNSLSLGLQQQQVGNLNQQQQQHQLAAMNNPRPMMAQANMMMNQAGAMNQMAMPGQQQPMQFAAVNQLQQQQPQQQQQNVQQQMQAGNQSIMMNNQQQQQQPGGGVLSNLLSSGKQIIGAATTPRMPNQPAQFSSMPGQLQQQHQQQQQPQLIDGGLNFGGQAPGQMGTMQGLNQVRQQLVGGAGMQSMATGALNQPAQMGATGADQQRQQLAMGNQQLNNSFSLMPNNSQPQQLHTGGYQQQQQQHQQPGMGFSAQRGPMSQPGLAGEEQGGNILNTFKNMLKL